MASAALGLGSLDTQSFGSSVLDSTGASASAAGSLDSFGNIINDFGGLAADIGTVYTLASEGRPSTTQVGNTGVVPGASLFPSTATAFGLSGGTLGLIMIGAIILVLVAVVLVGSRKK